MLLKWTLAILVLVASAIAPALAQQASTGTVTVISVPAGAEVRLEGESIVTGVSPVVFRYPLVGKYRLSVTRAGYETYRTDLILDPSKEMVVNVRLVAKTRFKAAIRSVFIPGWGQYYSGQRTKGLVYSLVAAASVMGYFIADNDFDRKLNRFNSRLGDFDRAEQSGVGFDQLEILRSDMLNEQLEAFDAETVRRISIGTIVGAWSLSVIDALLFFPEERGTLEIKGIALKPNYSMNQVGITLSRRF